MLLRARYFCCITALLCAVFTPVAARAATADVSGTWFGTLQAGAEALPLRLHIIREPDGTLSATLDSVAQNAFGIPVTTIRATNDTLTFTIAKIGASYSGSIRGERIAGTFTQNGLSFPLVFARTAPAAPGPTPVPTPFPRFTSTDVHFTSADGTVLAGTITVPEGAPHRFPAIIFVHGSGPLDRNETIGPNPVFLQLSNALSNAGYVVLRYDKRGIGKSGGSAANATRDELLADVRAAWAFAKAQADADPRRIFLLGHSEGGELVPSVAAGRHDLAGIVLMAPPALPIAQIIMQQVLSDTPVAQRAKTRPAELAFLEKIRNGTTKGAGMAWLRTSLDVDPLVDLKRVRVPMLILQGGSDTEVLPSDLPRLVKAARSANHDVSVHLFPGDNHLFMKVTPGEALTPQAALQQYLSVPGYIDSAVLRTLIAWLNAHSGR